MSTITVSNPATVTSTPVQFVGESVQIGGAAGFVGVFGATPVAQPTAAGSVSTVTAGSTTAVYVNTTFDGGIGTTGYGVGDIVAALKTLGIIAA